MAEALALFEAAGRLRKVIATRIELASAALLAGATHEAVALAGIAVNTLRTLSRSFDLGVALHVLCECLLVTADYVGARAAATEALPLLDQGDMPGATRLADEVAAIAALSGHFERSALLFGFGDAWHASNQSPRHPNSSRIVGKAAEELDAALGATEHHRLRASGAQLTEAQVASIVYELLSH